MYLNRLSTDDKMGFLILAKKAAKSNADITAEEKALISDYCIEMNIAPIAFDDIPDIALEDIAAGFSQRDQQSKNIILFELMGMMYADGNIDEAEKAFIYDFAKAIGFNKTKSNSFMSLMKKYVTAVSDISAAVLI